MRIFLHNWDLKALWTYFWRWSLEEYSIFLNQIHSMREIIGSIFYKSELKPEEFSSFCYQPGQCTNSTHLYVHSWSIIDNHLPLYIVFVVCVCVCAFTWSKNRHSNGPSTTISCQFPLRLFSLYHSVFSVDVEKIVIHWLLAASVFVWEAF